MGHPRHPFFVVLLGSLIAPSAVATDPFVDVGNEVGLDFVHFNGMSGELYLAEVMGAGGALLDYDRDGDLDVYLVQGSMVASNAPVDSALVPTRYPLPLIDRLYRNDSYLTSRGEVVVRFRDVTEQSRLAATGYGMGVAVGDVDNDGWVDIYLTNLGANQLWYNNRDGTFSDGTSPGSTGDPRWSVPGVFADFDGDGWLDLFVGNYVAWSPEVHKTCTTQAGARDYCSPQAFEAQPDLLLRNRGGTFEEVVRGTSGISVGPALGAVAEDFNSDGLIDLYVANDGEANQLWMNQGDLRFVDQAMLAGAAVNAAGQPEASMGAVAADLDGDGDVDLFLTHLERETNTLYVNDGAGLFEDRSRTAGVGMESWRETGFGAAALDYDGDGILDLVVVNGAVTTLEEQRSDFELLPLRQRNQLFRGLGGGRFEDVTATAGKAFEHVEVSRGLAVGDVDDDGDTDMLVTNNAGPARLLLDVGEGNARWLGAQVLGPAGRPALGAQVLFDVGEGTSRVRRVRTDGSYASASDPRVLVTFGDETKEVSVTVRWPHGMARRWLGIPTGGYVVLPMPAS